MRKVYLILFVLFFIGSNAVAQNWSERIKLEINECELADGTIVSVAPNAQIGPGVGIEYINEYTIRIYFASDDIPYVQSPGNYNIYYVDFNLIDESYGIAHDIDLISTTPINTSSYEETPKVSVDGKYLFYARFGGYNHRIWMAKKDENGFWSDPHQLPPPLDAGVQQQPGCFRDGELYFISRNRDGLGGGYDIWKCNFDPETDTASNFQKIVFNNYSWPQETAEADPYITPDKKRLYFQAYVQGISQGHDIYYSDWIELQDGIYGWSEPIRASEQINGIDDERNPVLTEDGRYIFFNAIEEGVSPRVTKLWYCKRNVSNADISGLVSIENSSVSAEGVVVALYIQDDDQDSLIVETVTDSTGSYLFAELKAGNYVVEVIPPIGYTADPESYQVELSGDDKTNLNFVLTPSAVTNNSRCRFYWKLQAWLALKGLTCFMRESLEDIVTNYPEEIFNHFYNHATNPIRIEGVTYMDSDGSPQPLTIKEIKKTLSVCFRSSEYRKAKAQYLALLLNVVSEKVGQQVVISEDERTVSRAITYIAELLSTDSDLNYIKAKSIARKINLRKLISAGVVSDGPSPLYNPQKEEQIAIAVFHNYPNPFNPSTTIRFTIDHDCIHKLAIYDIKGCLVKTLSEGPIKTGNHEITWRGDNDAGRCVASGIYFMKLNTPGKTICKKLVLLR